MSLFDTGLNDLMRLISEPPPLPPPPRQASSSSASSFLLELELQEAQAQKPPPPPPPPRPRPASPQHATPPQQKPRAKAAESSQAKQGAAPERPARKQAASRRGKEPAPEKRDETQELTAFVPVMERDYDEERGRGKHEEGQEEQEGGSAGRKLPAGGDLDCELLADELLQQPADEGIFEVLMPDGKTLGVVVRLDAQRAQFLLSPSDDDLAKLLKEGKMELERRLAQRMNKDVDISLL
jgi:hypothetical protein